MKKIGKYIFVFFLNFIILCDFVYADEYDSYLVESNSVSEYKVNLFDYWIHNSSSDSDYIDPSNTLYKGINNNHLLMFRKYKAAIEGDWNLWNRYKPYTNMVSYKLDSTKSPYLTISDSSLKNTNILKYRNNESLDYLFSTSYKDNSNRLVYSNVKGLLLNNSSIGDYYDSTKNYASYDESTNSFKIYNYPGVIGSGFGTYSDSKYTNKNFGQFFPFNKASEIFDIVDGKLKNKSNMQTANSNASILNHYFGLTLESDFTQPSNGVVVDSNNIEKDMTFTISGDDDIWLYIDEYLTIDLGGIHDAMMANINFATGKVIITPTFEDAQTADNTTEYFLGSIFENNPDVSDDFMNKNFTKVLDENGNIIKYTLKDNSKHTFKLFYLERGNTDSNLSLAFYPTINGYVEEEKTIINNPETIINLKIILIISYFIFLGIILFYNKKWIYRKNEL